jgi:Transposase, Mutator family
MEENLPQDLKVLALPVAPQRQLRTSNARERVNQELKRRTRIARLFPIEAALLRLVTALPAETSEEWATGKIHLDRQPQPSPPFGGSTLLTNHSCAANFFVPALLRPGTK